MKKSICILLALAVCLGLFTSLAAAAEMPDGKAEILEYYRAAVDKVRSGAAGYEKKAWQTVPELKIFGSAAADAAIKDLAGQYIMNESNAPVQKFARGSDDAKTHLPACTLSDLSKIKSASCVMDGGNYVVNIVLADEISPVDQNSGFLGQITDNFLRKDEIDKELSGISMLSDVSYDITYRDFTVSAVITPTGEFVSLTHFAYVEVAIHSATILSVFKLNDKSVGMTSNVSYTSFDYSGAAPVYVMLGDVSLDGTVTAEDARLALRRAVGLESYQVGSPEFRAADYDHSGDVTAADARAILRLAVGLDPLDAPAQEEPEQPLPPPSAETVALAEKYRAAIEKTRALEAGFSTLTWQVLPDLNVTGVEAVDSVIKNEVSKYVHDADRPEGWTYEKHTDAAAAHFPPFALTDYSRIVSAKSEQKDGNEVVTLVLADETDPRGGESFLGQVTDDIIFREDLDAGIAGVSIVNANPDYHVTYKNLTLTAEIAPDGTLVRMQHSVQAEIRVNSAILLVIPLQNKLVTMESDIVYYDFTY